METILIEHHWEIQSLDRPQKPQILQRTTQVNWITGKMVFEVTRLWLYTITYSRKNKHQSRHFIEEGLYRYQG